MAFQAKFVLDHVRDILQDQDGDRYTTDSLIRCLNQALQEVRRTRPDYFIGRFYEQSIGVQTGEDYINLPIFLFTPLMNYTAGMAEMRDDEFTTDGRAVALLTAFRQAMGSQ